MLKTACFMNREKSILRKQLKHVVASDRHRFHMPGHKGRLPLPLDCSLDVTEIPGADNLHAPDGVIREVQEKIAGIYGSGQSFLLTGGSTAGILASIMSLCAPGETILVPVNAHRSVLAALAFGQVEAAFYQPVTTPCGAYVTLDCAKEALASCPEAKGMLVVSPDYAGCLSETRAVAEYLHQHGKKLIVDEAHGAHLKFTDLEDAVSASADFVIQSTHKTLSALTQSSVLHLRDPKDRKTQKILSMIESSSPSYLQMMSIEEAVDEASEEAEKVFGEIAARWEAFEQNQNPSDSFRLVRPSDSFDPSKWLFVSSDGERDAEILAEFGIVPEVVYPGQILLMCGIHTTAKDFEALEKAVQEINRRYPQAEDREVEPLIFAPLTTEIATGKALRGESETIALEEASDRISASFVIAYPPGIPLIIPGMRLTSDLIETVLALKDSRYDLIGLTEQGGKISVDVLTENQHE